MTKRMLIDGNNPNFILDQLALQAEPMQWLRELVQNAMEANLRAQSGKGTGRRKTRVFIDMDRQLHARTGLRNLCVIDNGDGMTAAEMERNLNSLFVNGANRAQGLDGNFGLGAKITALYHNPHGVVFESWKNGKGVRGWLHKDRKSGAYGLKRLGGTDARPVYFARLDGDDKPAEILRNGTKVTLMGVKEGENTFCVPEAAELGGPSNWIHKYLNRRYFALPDLVEVKCRAMTSVGRNDAPDSDNSNLVLARGMKHMLDAHATASGKVRLSHAVAHWWTFPAPDKLAATLRTHARPTGHVGIAYKDECYWIRSGGPAATAMAQFGIKFAQNQVVLYIEPADSSGIRTDGARCELYVRGKNIQASGLWEIWGREFEQKLPQAIHSLIAERLARMDEENERQRRESTREHIDRFLPLFRVHPLRANRHGKILAAAPSSAMAARTAVAQIRETADHLTAQAATHKTGRRYHSTPPENLACSDGTDSRRALPHVGSRKGEIGIPAKILWVSEKEQGRLKDELVDLAAEIQGCPLTGDTVKINEDFRGYQDLVDYIASERGVTNDPDAMLLVRHAVQDVYQKAVAEAIVALRCLVLGNPSLSDEERRKRLSPESLTAALLVRSYMVEKVKQKLKFTSEASRRNTTEAEEGDD